MLLIEMESTGKRNKKQSELSHKVKKRKPWGPVQIGEAKSGLRKRETWFTERTAG